jgi:hypothetical protein
MRHMLHPRPITVAAAMLAAVSPPAHAQVRASERATVSQTVDGTVITVDYGRPQMRGRDSLFGKVVPHDEIWTPGANQSTTLQVSRDVTLAGKPLPAGKYSLWMVTRPGDWKLYVHKDATRFHTNPPRLDDMFLSIPVTPVSGEAMEMLTFDFPCVAPDSTELRFRWGTRTVTLPIEVQPSFPSVAMTPEQLEPYLGSYSVTFPSPNNGRSLPMRFAIINAKGRLHGIMDDKEPMEMELLPTKTPHQFMPAFLQHGKIYDVETMPVVFEIANGRAVGFQVGTGKSPWMIGTRTR